MINELLAKVDAFTEGLPSVDELDRAIGSLESAYDDITKRYIEQRLKLLGLRQAAKAISDQRTRSDAIGETEDQIAATKHRGESNAETDISVAAENNPESPIATELSIDETTNAGQMRELDLSAGVTPDVPYAVTDINRETTEAGFLGETEPQTELPYSSRIKWRGYTNTRRAYEWLEKNGPRRTCEAELALGIPLSTLFGSRKDLFRRVGYGVYDIRRQC